MARQGGLAGVVLTSSTADELPTRYSCRKTYARYAIQLIQTAVNHLTHPDGGQVQPAFNQAPYLGYQVVENVRRKAWSAPSSNDCKIN